MGLWYQMSDGTAIHIDFAVRKSCWNLEASIYGNCFCYIMETGATETHAELEENGMYRVTWEVPGNGVQGV